MESQRDSMIGLCWPAIAAWGGFGLFLALDHALSGGMDAVAPAVAITLACIGALGAARACFTRASPAEKAVAFVCNASFPAAVGLFVALAVEMSNF